MRRSPAGASDDLVPILVMMNVIHNHEGEKVVLCELVQSVIKIGFSVLCI